MKKNSLLTLAFMISSSAFATSVFASENEHREHGAHQHGQAQLNVILENNDLMVMLETPAMNVFGFEHEPKNVEQKKVVELAIKDLENISPYIKTDSSAECKIAKIDVDQPFDAHGEHNEHEAKDDHDHDDDHKAEHKAKDDHDEKHDEGHAKEHDDHEDHEEHEKHEESAHSDIDVEITYKCENGAKLTQLDLSAFFKRFPGFEDIDAQIIANGQQNAAELTKDQTMLILKK
ncbi:DUF2796 domain-containing protein [uncultured Cocleimonas sp.]|uniref:DUF2796 domain-containing protein n=1 Tax=uncultured Cocleimonas sp. TaxID=1051587 RepID=UPI002631D37F|nr:DUF2796 domain-containing protein [uncultured Cocleimonas sp.]